MLVRSEHCQETLTIDDAEAQAVRKMNLTVHYV